MTLFNLSNNRRKGELTPLGRILANLAADPQLGKLMVLGCVFSCLDPVLTVVAALEYKSPFYITKVGAARLSELRARVGQCALFLIPPQLTKMFRTVSP